MTPSRPAQVGAFMRDALLELRARRLFWVVVVLGLAMLGGATILLESGSSLTVTVNGQTRTTQGAANIAAMILPGFVQFLALAAAIITLFGLNGVLASITDRGTAEVYLSRPAPRWVLLLARFAGYWCAAMGAVCVIELALWTLVGVRTGSWSPRLFASLPFIGLVEIVFLAVLALFNALTGSAAMSGLIGFALYVVTDVLRNHEALASVFRSPAWRAAVEWGYRVLPKPGEIASAIGPFLQGRADVPWFAVWTSLAFSAIAVLAAARVFARKDY